MKDDPIVAEVRRAREALAAQSNHDLYLIVENARKNERANPARKYSASPDGTIQEIDDVGVEKLAEAS